MDQLKVKDFLKNNYRIVSYDGDFQVEMVHHYSVLGLEKVREWVYIFIDNKLVNDFQHPDLELILTAMRQKLELSESEWRQVKDHEIKGYNKIFRFVEGGK